MSRGRASRLSWDTDARDPNPLDWFLPPIAGRFYGVEANYNVTGFASTIVTNNLWAIPMLNGRELPITKLGIETTATQPVGSFNAAIYDLMWIWDKPTAQLIQIPWPGALVCQTGEIATSAAQYYSGSVTYYNDYRKVPQGLTWCCFVPSVNMSFQEVGNASFPNRLGSGYNCSTFLFDNVDWGIMRVTNGSHSLIQQWPLDFPFCQASNALTIRRRTDGDTHPRIRYEV